jgi:nitroreductase
MDVMSCIGKSLAVRYYLDRPVPPEVVRSILDAGRATGSGKNTQLWHFIVVTERSRLVTLSKTGTYAGHLADAALCVVILTAENPHVQRIAYFDAGRAAQNIMLAATAHGLGACPVGFRNDLVAANALLEVPAGMEIVIGIALGYPDLGRTADEAAFRIRVLDHQGRKPLESMVSDNAFGRPIHLSR